MKKGDKVPVKVLFSNIRGFNSKKESLAKVLEER